MELKLIATSTSRGLATKISKKIGVPLTKMRHVNFKNGEHLHAPQETLRGCDVYIIHTFKGVLIDREFMELLITVRAVKNSAAARLVRVVIPLIPYMRQDRRTGKREPITARLIADLIREAGADHVITMDLHSPQEQGFFDILCDNQSPRALFEEHFRPIIQKSKKFRVVSPDIGGASKADTLSEAFGDLGVDPAIIYKRKVKNGNSNDEIKKMFLLGDVEDADCLLIDDIIDTAGTIKKAAFLLREKGARDIYVAATNPLLSGNAKQNLIDANFKEIVITDSFYIPKRKVLPCFKVLSIDGILADGIIGAHNAKSVQNLVEV